MTRHSNESRNAILSSLRRSLARDVRQFRDDVDTPAKLACPAPVTSAEGDRLTLARSFGAKLEAVDGSCEIVETADVQERIVALTARWNGQKRPHEVLSWAPTELPLPDIGRRLEEAGIALVVPDDLHDEAGRAHASRLAIGLTGVDAAFASTGSVALVSGRGKSRAAALLPLHHMMLVPMSRIHPTVESWLQGLRREERSGDLLRDNAQVTFVTGPSKSADIELNLTLGVHGPRVLHAIVFDDRC